MKPNLPVLLLVLALSSHLFAADVPTPAPAPTPRLVATASLTGTLFREGGVPNCRLTRCWSAMKCRRPATRA